MKQKISIALIHNHNCQRNNYLFPYLKSLQTVISNHHSTSLFEISSQPDIVPLSLSLAVSREFSYWWLSRKWKNYCLVRTWPLYSDIVRPLKNVLKKYIFTTSKNRIRMLRHGRIEMVVTDKHMRAWKEFFRKEDDLLICFEDDAVFKENSIRRVVKLIESVPNEITSSHGVYVDLAGGCSFKELHLDRIEYKKDNSFRYFIKPVTNTACCYMINRRVAEVFLSEIEKSPNLRLIGIDWLISQLFMKSEASLKCLCKHADPHILNHGSFTGQYFNWRHNTDER